jgi:hypothetical protein
MNSGVTAEMASRELAEARRELSPAEAFGTFHLLTKAGIVNGALGDDEQSQAIARSAEELNPDWQPGMIARMGPLTHERADLGLERLASRTVAAGRSLPRAREARPSRRRRSSTRSSTRSSPSASGEGGEPPQARLCAHCGAELNLRPDERANKRYCSESHRQMAYQDRRRERQVDPALSQRWEAGINEVRKLYLDGEPEAVEIERMLLAVFAPTSSRLLELA